MCTKKGVIKKTTLRHILVRGPMASMRSPSAKDDELLQAKLTDGNNEILMGLAFGQRPFDSQKERFVLWAVPRKA